MSFKHLLAVVAAALLVAWGVSVARDPHRTSLPFGTTDLKPIAASLARLPAEERQLVEDYVRRSRGDVLPPQFADPDEPLTARTVGEAIALQRKFIVRMREQEAKAEARRADREAAYAPLREWLAVRMLRREIMSWDAAQGIDRGSRSDSSRQVLVTTWQLENLGRESIDALKAAVTVRKRHPRSNELGVLDGCYFERNEPLAPQERLEIRCVVQHGDAGRDAEAYLAMTEEDFRIDYEPRLVRVHNGPILTADP